MSSNVPQHALPEDFHVAELNKTVWEIPNRYVRLEPVGAGAYGQVCAADDTKHKGKRVAIKKLARPFQTVIHAKRTYRELRLLKHMRHENVICLLDCFTPDPVNLEVYMVTCLMGADLNSIVKCQSLTNEHVQFLIYQVLRGLKYIHSAGVIHRDLKPSNIAVNEDCELKILDFGLARSTDDSMTGYVATRWYRAPEIMLNWMHYTDKVDIWSVGCIMAEILTGKTLFPGSDHINQLNKIVKVTGIPDETFLQKITSDSARQYLMTLPAHPKRDFRSIFTGADPLAVDLLEKMLQLDDDKRVSAEQALQHPYLMKFHDPDDEPTAPLFDDSLENSDIPIDEWKQRVYKEIVDFTPDREDTFME